MEVCKKQSLQQLLSTFVWGKEPENEQELRRLLIDAGVDIDTVVKDVDAVIRKYAPPKGQ